ncbi:MAG: 50S ribosomal protein L11 [Candidatus Shikimatogenerans sp. JK-2022]|nr:50S ribosomal protein L11 [Candidatus Shikimatogenerans bostrichidophilus]
MINNKKEILKIIKIKITSGQANPAPPLGPALGSVGIKIMDFCNKFNNYTKNKYKKNEILHVNIIIYIDKSFDFIIKKKTIKDQVLEILNIKKGSNEPNKKKIGDINISDIYKIAKYKMSDLNCLEIKSAVSMIEGSLKSMGVNIKYDEKKNNKKKENI